MPTKNNKRNCNGLENFLQISIVTLNTFAKDDSQQVEYLEITRAPTTESIQIKLN